MSETAGSLSYRIVVEGCLDDGYAVLFEGMRLTREGGSTAIAGPVLDQAALLGLIYQALELGLELISLEQLGHDSVAGLP